MPHFTFKSRHIHRKILTVNAIDIHKISFNQQNIQILRALNHNKTVRLHSAPHLHTVETKRTLTN